MKKTLLLSLLCASLFADSVNWKTYKESFHSAQSDHKMMVVMVGATTCHFCSQAKDRINTNKELVGLLNSVHPIYINQDKDFTPSDLSSAMTPTLYFLNFQGKIMNKPIVGFIENEELIQTTMFHIQKTKKN
jgi:thioredoxin-related protein